MKDNLFVSLLHLLLDDLLHCQSFLLPQRGKTQIIPIQKPLLLLPQFLRIHFYKVGGDDNLFEVDIFDGDRF